MTFKAFRVTIQSSEGEQKQKVSVNPMTIGRSYSVDLPLILTEVSRCHLKIYWQNDQIFIEDLGSKNGTYLNSDLIPAHTLVPYKSGDEITLGHTKEILRLEVEQLSKEASEPPPLENEPPQKDDDSMVQVLEREHPFAPAAEKHEELGGLKEEVEIWKNKRVEAEAEVKKWESKLLKVKNEIQEMESTWKSRSQELLSEQEKIKKELQVDLNEMKMLFDSRNEELEKVQRNVDVLTKRESQLQVDLVAKEKLLNETEEEAERLFISRQNDLIEEQQKLENLKDTRTLEVELEMAQLKEKLMAEIKQAQVDVEMVNPWKIWNLDTRRVAGFFVMVFLVFAVAWVFKPKVETAEMASQAECESR